jgi:hypothetical protein
VSDNWSALGSGLEHGVTHPLDVGKAMINWEDLAAGEYDHWVGELAPSVAAAFRTPKPPRSSCAAPHPCPAA